MLISGQSNIKQQEQPKDYRSAVLNAVRTFNMSIMGTYNELFSANFKNEDELNEAMSLFANTFVVEYKDDGVCYAIMHNEVTIWISTDESMPNSTEDIINILYDYYDAIVSEANKVRKKLK